MKKIRVFLGGTCNGSLWRECLTPLLKTDYFNPVVEEWNEEAYQRELAEREEDDFVLYCITPKMTGVYSIAEVVDDSNKRPEKTILCVLEEDAGERWGKVQGKSVSKVSEMVRRNGGASFSSLVEVANFLNTKQLFAER